MTTQERLSVGDIQVTENQIRNSIKRKIYGYIEYKGSKKTGGYYMKDYYFIYVDFQLAKIILKFLKSI